eukprot:15048947-Heterocapsa_arctica.AAC.1
MQEIANNPLEKQQVSSRMSAPIMGKPAAPTNKRRTIHTVEDLGDFHVAVQSQHDDRPDELE